MAPYSSTNENENSINNIKENYENDREVIYPYENVKNVISYNNSNQNTNLNNGKQSSLKDINEVYSKYCELFFNNTSTMATYAQYMPQQIYNFPITHNDWNSIITLPTSVYTTPVQVAFVTINPQPVNPGVVTTQLCPCGTVITEPVITVVSPTVISEPIPIAENYYEPLVNYIPEAIAPPSSNIHDIESHNEDIVAIEDTLTPTELSKSDGTEESVECYLRLPKELFPTARMFTIDPNQIIDVFCDQQDICDHAPWLLDLEFGIPRIAVTRHIPIYDVQFNSIHCKNTPSAIHPGFERCSKTFKRELLFYYDCIVSTWYKGFVAMKNDTSVKNFQAWLLQAMQVFGMCWP